MPELICPICGTRLKEGVGAMEWQYKGKTYQFCTLDCLHLFQQFPESYVDQEGESSDGILDLTGTGITGS